MNDVLLYYWESEYNIGDFLSYYIVKSLSKSKVEYRNPFIKRRNLLKSFALDLFRRQKNYPKYNKEYLHPSEKILFAIGSILDWAPTNAIIWGSGFREYDSRTECKDIRAVRGYLSRQLLPSQFADIPVGDPAILLPLILPVGNRTTKRYEISLIPHFKDKYSFPGKERFNLIDIQCRNIDSFVLELVSSKFVLSSSLHGLILAHSYGIPALWVKHGNTGSSDFKFQDYYSSLGLGQVTPLYATELNNNDYASLTEIFYKNREIALPPEEKFISIRKNLLNTVPFNLKDIYK